MGEQPISSAPDRWPLLLAPVSSAAPEPNAQQQPNHVPPLLATLVDDATLFPPTKAAVADAIRDYLEVRDSAHARLYGAFLCPASKLPELITELNRAKPKQPLDLSLVIDTGLGGLPKAISIIESRTELLNLVMVEMPAPSDVDEMWLERVAEFVPEEVEKVVEVRRGGPWLTGVELVAAHNCQPKLRCGGQREQNFPSTAEVADFLAIVSHSPSPFRATAGLHNAVRTVEKETGFTYHGVLNLLVATARSLSGHDVRSALEEQDGAALAEELTSLSPTAAQAVRGVFASYSTHTLTDPTHDLAKLGLL